MTKTTEAEDQAFNQMWIRELLHDIEATNRKINKIAKLYIPEFHFLNHRVSNFWKCDASPIGWCVWDISKRGFHIDCQCYFCKGPVERK